MGKQTKHSRKTSHFIFGINGCENLLKTNKYTVLSIELMDGGHASKKGEFKNYLHKYSNLVQVLPRDKYLKKYSQYRTQGIVIYFQGVVLQKPKSYEDIDGNIGLLILDNIEDPQNAGQILRTAECAGMDGVVFPEHHSVGLTPTVLQVSQGAFVHLNLIQCGNLKQYIDNLKKQGFWIVALENGIDAKPWYEIDLTGKIAIIVGSEGKGIRQNILKACDFKATIPMQGFVNSLNVSAAVSAMVFERERQILSVKK